MTRNEFLDGYMLRSFGDTGIIFMPGARKLDDGSVIVAVPCDCGDESCEGWQAVWTEFRRETAQLIHAIAFDGPAVWVTPPEAD